MKWSSLRSGDSKGSQNRGPSPHPSSQPPGAGKPRDSRAKEETQEGAAVRGANNRPASGNSRVTARRRRAPRGEAVADRWRLRTGSAHCAPLLPNRPPARPPPVRRVSRRESGGGCGACGRSLGLFLLPFPSPPSHTPFPIPAPSPSRPPYSGQECPARNNLAAPRWLWSRSSGRLPPAPPPAPAPR